MHVLAIVAHPDDASIFCGATLAKHADRGDDVTVVHMTRGEYGGLGNRSEADVAATRTAEARRAGAVMGAAVEFLGFEDGRLTTSLENRHRVVETIRGSDPDLILTHFDDDRHPDHRATATLVSDAYYMASLPLVETEHPPVDPDNVYYFGKVTSSFDPTTFVDVSGFVDAKVEAIRHHESQVEFLRAHGGIDDETADVIEDVRARARTVGRRVGAPAAEGFRPLHEPSREYLG